MMMPLPSTLLASPTATNKHNFSRIMNHNLLAWYGITDLLTSLCFESGNSPVLRVLMSGEFSDVVIVAYGVPGKVAAGRADRDP
jgi:hypothetical protein